MLDYVLEVKDQISVWSLRNSNNSVHWYIVRIRITTLNGAVYFTMYMYK